MSKQPSINYTVSNKLCTGCGVCEDICPQQAISFHSQNGINIPVINKSLCLNDKGCSRCYQVCSGIGISIRKFSKQLFKRKYVKFDYYIGYFQNCYAGYSNKFNIRYHSASGGLLTQFLIYLFQKGVINGAIVTRFRHNSPTIPETIIATSEEEIISGRSSKYCPVSHNGIASIIKKLEGKFIIVGLPCHIQGFRKYEQNDLQFKKKILGYFAIYCSYNRTFNGTEYVFSR